MIIRLISCFKHAGRSGRERSELFAEIIGNHLVLESSGRSIQNRKKRINLQNNQIHLTLEPLGRSRRERLELIYKIIKLISDWQIGMN